MKWLLVPFYFLIAVLASQAMAKDNLKLSVDNLRSNCKIEIKKFCKGDFSGPEFLPQCVAKNKNKVSKTCSKALLRYLKVEKIELEDLTTSGE